MILLPTRAAVRPRVVPVDVDKPEPMLLEDRLSYWLARKTTGAIELLGGRGEGVTTALCHLAAVFEGQERLSLTEQGWCRLHASAPWSNDPIDAPPPGSLPVLERLKLVPWNRDDCVEYLLQRHRDRAASVMKRLENAGDLRALRGNPELVSTVLTCMAEDESLAGALAALERHTLSLLAQSDDPARLERDCLPQGWLHGADGATADRNETTPNFPRALRIFQHPQARAAIAARAIVRELDEHTTTHEHLQFIPRTVVERMAPLLSGAPKALQLLRTTLETSEPREAGACAGLLHAADGAAFRQFLEARRTQDHKPPSWQRARLVDAQWRALELPMLSAPDSDFTGADLSLADLTRADLRRATLVGANLHRAQLLDVLAQFADFSHADLSESAAFGSEFHGADLSYANFEGARLHSAKFGESRLVRTRFVDATLCGATFLGARIDGADFTSADLRGADLRKLDLRTCTFHRARFDEARCSNANFAGLELDRLSFCQAQMRACVLTGTKLRGATLRHSRLVEAQLGDLDAEGADFRGADFSRANFHFGSTRSGLVFNSPPMEGTRTGFYADYYHSSPHRHPEEVRCANLCGADLREAKVFATDFYLVDLRHALYDAVQVRHFRRCGAILSARDE